MKGQRIRIRRTAVDHIFHHEKNHDEGLLVCVHAWGDDVHERIVDTGPSAKKDRWGGISACEYKERGAFMSRCVWDVDTKTKAIIVGEAIQCARCEYVRMGVDVKKSRAPWKAWADFVKHREQCKGADNSSESEKEEDELELDEETDDKQDQKEMEERGKLICEGL